MPTTMIIICTKSAYTTASIPPTTVYTSSQEWLAEEEAARAEVDA